MNNYLFKKVLLVITCFSLVLLLCACGDGSLVNSHAKISTDPDKPSSITFPETSDDGDFYQCLYNSEIDDPDADPGTIYGCYKGIDIDNKESNIIFCKPKLPQKLAQFIEDNDLDYYAVHVHREGGIKTEDIDDIEDLKDLENYDLLTVFKDNASYYVTSNDHKKIKTAGFFTPFNDKDSIYADVGFGEFNEDFTIFTPLDEELAISMINTDILRYL